MIVSIVQSDSTRRIAALSWQQLIDFLTAQRGNYRIPLTEHTELLRDLGIDGDDAVEFFTAFADTFNCDVRSLDLRLHFHGEGLDIFGGIVSLFRTPPPLTPITLGMLAEAIGTGRLTSHSLS